MTEQEKAHYIAEFEDAHRAKAGNMMKGERIRFEKVHQVLKDQMSRITDNSAVTIHGLKAEFDVVNSGLQAQYESKTPNPAEIEKLKKREKKLLEQIYKVVKQTNEHMEATQDYKAIGKPKNSGLMHMFDEQAMVGKGYVDIKNQAPRKNMIDLTLKGPNLSLPNALPVISSKYKRSPAFSLDKMTQRDYKHLIYETNGEFTGIE